MDNLLNEKFRNLIETLNDLIFLYKIKPSPKFDYVSPSSTYINGYTPEEHYKDPFLFEKLVPKEDSELLEFMNKNPEMIKKPIVIRWRRKDGTIIWTEQRLINIFDDENKLVAIAGIIHDITEQKNAEFALRESEKKFRELFHQITDSIVILESIENKKRVRIVEANDATCNMFGYSKNELFSASVNDFIGKKDLSIVKNLNFQKLRRKEIFLEIEAVRKDGKKFPADMKIYGFRLNNKNAAIAIIRDITTRKKIEKELIKTKKLESISVLAAGIAHDFNNILSAILGNISLAKVYSEENKDLFNLLEESEKAALKAKTLTGELLTFSKGGTPIMEVKDIREIIKKATMFSVRGSNVKCFLKMQKDLYPVNVDSAQISQAINNLVINACEAMPDGGILEVFAENQKTSKIKRNQSQSRDQKFVKIEFKDTGIGIEKENLFRIFDPFFTTKEFGSGLGLSSTYSIIQKHGGFIDVESVINKGSSFFIYLPASDKKIIKEVFSKKKIKYKKNPNILVMDDDEGVRIVVEKFIKELGFMVDFAKDGEEAISLYKNAYNENKKYDLVIMDLTVPGGIGGEETIKELLKFDLKINAIVSSGYHNDPIVSNFKNYGFKGFMAKPYTFDDFKKIILKLL